MRDSYNQNFELSVLLRQGDLDIRGLAARNPSITVGDYNNSLSKFTNHAAFAIDALTRVSQQISDKSDYQMLVDLRALLEEINCKKYLKAINDIAEECRRGNKPYAASCAKQIYNEFSSFLKKVTASRKLPKKEVMDKVSGIADIDPAVADLTGSTQLLKVVLERLDRNEATRKMRILVVDDAPVILKTISAILGDEYKVYGMTNPAMVEKFLQQITPELFLLDYKMPEINGFELIPIIRSFDEHKDTPIIFLTSMGTIDHVSAAMMLGARDFLVKPVQPDMLREKVAKHIVRKKLF
ncbi:MAG: response regulator [Treponema sp.]|nr:response regulator [Treponema sp.]